MQRQSTRDPKRQRNLSTTVRCASASFHTRYESEKPLCGFGIFENMIPFVLLSHGSSSLFEEVKGDRDTIHSWLFFPIYEEVKGDRER